MQVEPIVGYRMVVIVHYAEKECFYNVIILSFQWC